MLLSPIYTPIFCRFLCVPAPHVRVYRNPYVRMIKQTRLSVLQTEGTARTRTGTSVHSRLR